MTSSTSADTRILARLSALPAEPHSQFRAALASAAVSYRRDAPGLARVWCAFADCGHTDDAISKALERCTVDDLEHVRSVLVGAELGSRRNTRLRDVWGACRDVVADELARRKAAAPAKSAAPVAQEPVLTGPTRTAIIAMLRRNPDGLRTQDVTARLGGSATRSALHRLRRAGVVELRDGRNFLRASAQRERPRMEPAVARQLSNAAAITTWSMQEPSRDLDAVAGDLIDDLSTGDPAATVAAFVSLTRHLVDQLADATGQAPEQLWRDTVHQLEGVRNA